MSIKILSTLISAGLFFFSAQINAAVNFHISSDAIATAQWDTWSFGPSYAGFGPPSTVSPQSGSQGGGVLTGSGANFTSTDVTTNIINDYSAPPGGLLGAGDSFYIHNGAYTWDVDVELDSAATHFRVSYALANSPSFGAASDFSITPYSTSGASSVASGSYQSVVGGSDNAVFYTTFQVLGPPSASFSASFGDVVFGGPSFPGTFKSIDGIYVEAFSGSPAAVPEPQAFALIGGLIAICSLAVRRRVRS